METKARKSLSEQGDERREQIVEFIRRFQADHRYAPSMAEIGVAVGLKKNTVRHHLLKLQNEGRVAMDPGVYRSLRVTEGDTVEQNSTENR